MLFIIIFIQIHFNIYFGRTSIHGTKIIFSSFKLIIMICMENVIFIGMESYRDGITRHDKIYGHRTSRVIKRKNRPDRQVHTAANSIWYLSSSVWPIGNTLMQQSQSQSIHPNTMQKYDRRDTYTKPFILIQLI